VVTFYKDYDELYWDINGDQWQQPFEHVQATIELPKGAYKRGMLQCFAGSYGTTDSSNCTFSSSGNESGDTVIVQTKGPLAANQTLTAVIGLNKGVFTPPTWWEQNGGIVTKVALYAALPVITLLVLLNNWWRLGRDPKGRGVIAPEFTIPDNLSPAEVGTLVDFRLDNRDISATIIDLAIRKYLKIIETKSGLMGRSKSYQLELLNPDYSQLRPYERQIMEGLFTPATAGTVVKLSDLASFYKTAKDVRETINSSLTKDKLLFYSNPNSRPKTFTFIGSAFLLGGFLLHSLFALPLIISGLMVLAFGGAMSRRTVQGVADKEKVEGLRMYLKTAEEDRLKMLQSPDSPYVPKTAGPVRTVELFEKLLPYAIVLKVEKEWAKQFESIYTQAPDWYAGNWTTFNSYALANSLTGTVNAMGSSFAPPSSSGGSGFGGGGFSGGGGGGGGGGGW
jgi:uncharacterized membrane protein YgcG